MCDNRIGKAVHPTSGDAYFYDYCIKRHKPCVYCDKKKKRKGQKQG